MCSRAFVIAIGFLLLAAPAAFGFERCPYDKVKDIINATAERFPSAPEQTAAISQVMEHLTKAYWGVVIVEDDGPINDKVHWSIPNIWSINGNDAFCMTVINGWQYSVFMIYDKERITSRSRRHAVAVPRSDQDITLNTF